MVLGGLRHARRSSAPPERGRQAAETSPCNENARQTQSASGPPRSCGVNAALRGRAHPLLCRAPHPFFATGFGLLAAMGFSSGRNTFSASGSL